MTGRMDRVAELIKREVSVILQTELDDPCIEGITINRIEVTKDIRLAKIFFTVPDKGSDVEKIKQALKSHAKFVRGELAHRTSLKYTPKLSFREDVFEEYQRSVDKVFEKIESDREGKETGKDEQEGARDEL